MLPRTRKCLPLNSGIRLATAPAIFRTGAGNLPGVVRKVAALQGTWGSRRNSSPAPSPESTTFTYLPGVLGQEKYKGLSRGLGQGLIQHILDQRGTALEELICAHLVGDVKHVFAWENSWA